MESIFNGTPVHISRGFEVAKAPAVAPQSPNQPWHYPHVWGFAERGVLNPQTITNNFTDLYGAATLRPQGKFLTHQSLAVKVLAGKANQFKFQRLVAEDAKQSTIVTFSGISVAPVSTQIASGWVRTGDTAGLATGSTVDQHLVVWLNRELLIPEGKTIAEALAALNGHTEKVVLNVAGASVEFDIYPVFAETQTHGAYGDRCGYTIDTMDAKTANPLDVEQAERIGGRMHTIRFWERPEGGATANVIPTRHGGLEAKFSLVENAYDPKNNTHYAMLSTLADSYSQMDPQKPKYPTYAPYENFVYYAANYATVVNKLATLENAKFDDGLGAMFISPFTGKDVNGDKYYSFRLVEPTQTLGAAEKVIRWGHGNINYLMGGADGNTSNEKFDELVRAKLTSFGTEFFQGSREKYPVSVFYDTGFELPTKELFGRLTATRRDVFVGWSTHIHGQTEVSPVEELSIARAIMAAAQLYPESSYYGTSFCRGFLAVGSGEYSPEVLPWRVSQIFHYMEKLAAYAGSGEGKLKAGADFATYPGNRVDILTNLSNPYREDEIRVEEWEFGMNVAIPYDENSFHTPGIFTMFGDDTSPMKSVINMLIAVVGEKAARTCWHKFAGNDKLSKEGIRAEVNKEIKRLMAPSKFDDRLNQFSVETIFTRDDLARGYSWSTRLKYNLAMPMNVGTFDHLIDRLEEGLTAETFS